MLSYGSILPEELILEILYKLPPKSLVKCTAVCKSWNQLIKTPTFICNHLHGSFVDKGKTKRHHFLLLPMDWRQTECGKNLLCSLYLEDGKKLKQWEHFDFPFNYKLDKWGSSNFDVMGSCNGLVLLVQRTTANSHGFHCILWNPCVHKYVRLPLPPLCFEECYTSRFDIAFDSITGDFKVVRNRITYKNCALTEVYSLINTSWRIVTRPDGYQFLWRNGPSCSVNGFLHWIVYFCGQRNVFHGFLVLAFDIHDEVFSDISLPLCSVGSLHSVRVFTYQSSIAFTQYRHTSEQYDIWVMKEYRNPDSWAKLWCIDATKMMISKILGFINDGELVLRLSGGDVVSLDLNAQQIGITLATKTWYNDMRFLGVHEFVHSLILFENGDDVHTTQSSLGSSFVFDQSDTTLSVSLPWVESSDSK